ncbi:DUF6543 domain-containing protein [Pseudomonas sp. RC10]|uniref:dermonecrotic toxin domain-containing protein n=1 Tax=Pseudomonas bambusae TaxID=3139142 RepID=UPI003138E658
MKKKLEPSLYPMPSGVRPRSIGSIFYPELDLEVDEAAEGIGYEVGLPEVEGPEIVPIEEGGRDPHHALLLTEFLASKDLSFPSPKDFAHDKAKAYVLEHLELDIDPDDLIIATLYIDAADHGDQRANLAYSMTLTEALMRNWQQEGDGHFYDHLGTLEDWRLEGYPAVISEEPLSLDQCFAYEAIYRKTAPQHFDGSAQVHLDPKPFKRFIWEADLQSHYEELLNDFWAAHRDDYHVFIKASLLRAAYVQHEEGSLSDEDKALVLDAVGLKPEQPWETLAFEAFRDAPLNPQNVTIRELGIYCYTATDIIVLKDERTERLVMYIPGNSSPLHGFDDMAALRDWFALQCRYTQRRTALEGHFKIEDGPDGVFYSGLQSSLKGLGAYPNWFIGNTHYWNPASEINLGPALSPWPFSHFKKNLQSRLKSDARRLFRSRADYNKETAAEILSAAINVTGVIAMVVPGLWAPLAVMSVALIGLGADQVIEGTVEEQHEGAGRIVFGVLNAVPALAEGAGKVLGAAAVKGEPVAAGAADEIGQKISSATEEERTAASAEAERAETHAAEEKQARATESEDERGARRDQEEQRRADLRAHHAAHFDAVKAFGVEPAGLRSLSPALRADLASFEYVDELPAGGEWNSLDEGNVYSVFDKDSGSDIHFARVHAKVYRVEFVENAQQYRIVSSRDSTLKGPYVKKLKGFYSDIDVRPGLRGGDSYVPGDEPVPEIAPVKEDIPLVRAQPPLFVEIPLDGIEVRPVVGDDGQEIDQFFIPNPSKDVRVSYDVDLGCWKKNAVEFRWMDNNGVWKSGNEDRFLKVRGKLLPPVKSEIYKFPRVPGVAKDTQAVNRTVHHVWLGSRLPDEHLIAGMKANMETNPDLSFTLHIQIDDTAIVDGASPQAQLQAAFAGHPNMTVSNLEEEPFFTHFRESPHTAEPFNYFREGSGQNYAAASDVVRYPLLHEYGGIYMDCDDVIKVSFEGQALNAGPNDVLMGEAVSSSRMDFFGPGNSHFASHPGNPVLREVQSTLYARFKDELDALVSMEADKSQVIDGKNPYMTKIFFVTGPRLLLDTLKSVRPDYAALLDNSLHAKSGISSLTYQEYVIEAQDFYVPFGRRLKITAGAENSWHSAAS